MANRTLTEQIDSLLPQTQCQACHYKDCLSYASAIANHDEATNLCQPGGPRTYRAIEQLKPTNSPCPPEPTAKHIAVIQDDYCVGCLKCIKACPVDAIFGSQGKLHTVISDICTGCNLCVDPCPTDCIEMVAVPATTTTSAVDNKTRYLNKKSRLVEKNKTKKDQHKLAKLSRKSYSKTQEARLNYILNVCCDES